MNELSSIIRKVLNTIPTDCLGISRNRLQDWASDMKFSVLVGDPIEATPTFAFCGIPVKVDTSIPDDEIRFENKEGKVLWVIKNLGPAEVDDAAS